MRTSKRKPYNGALPSHGGTIETKQKPRQQPARDNAFKPKARDPLLEQCERGAGF